MAQKNTYPITTVPNEVLKETLERVSSQDIAHKKYAELLQRMRTAMVEYDGVGLAANQIGERIRAFVIDAKLAEEYGISDAYFNPEITEYSKEDEVLEEGCLSIPEYFIPIRRAKKIKFKALNEQGEKVKFKARGFLARVLQHETDHLNGCTIKERSRE